MPSHSSRSPRKPIRAIVTGATGMVGEGVLHECLQHPDVEQVLVLGRKSCGVTHPKLVEIVHGNLYDLSSVEERLASYNACFFCLGVSSVGMKEADYAQITYTLTMHVAETLVRLNPDMVFCYVTGMSTDSTEQGSSMWARVKGRTENHLLRLPFKAAYMFRPGYIHPTKGLNNAHRYYRALSWLYPLLKRVMPNAVLTLREIGQAMINSVHAEGTPSVLEPPAIRTLAATQGGK